MLSSRILLHLLVAGYWESGVCDGWERDAVSEALDMLEDMPTYRLLSPRQPMPQISSPSRHPRSARAVPVRRIVCCAAGSS
jgi:hypothetical protein